MVQGSRSFSSDIRSPKNRAFAYLASASILAEAPEESPSLHELHLRDSFQLEAFSVERLMNFLTALARDVDIVIRRRPGTRRGGRIVVTAG
jgi:hypothetical protein